MNEHNFIVSAEEAGTRLDILLSNFSKNKRLGLSRVFIKGLILDGAVRVKNEAIIKPHYKVKSGEEVGFGFMDKVKGALKAEDIKLDIVYEDEDLAVINKPTGMVVHPAPGNYEHTLVNALKNIFKSLSDINPDRPGIVHRLDKETSGLLVIAKNNASHLDLVRQFAEHSVKKEYLAIVKGSVEFDEGMIEAPIARHATRRKNMAVNFSDQAKEAKTHYRTLKRYKNFSLLELKPFTGRTHQLRVHLDFIGHPILGDDKYGKGNEFTRLALHAKTLGFTHPRTGKFVEFKAPIPKELNDFLNKS
ncbi:MAG: RluA family pseudouridine synthase [Candidatus Omnitrophota bacterium]|jgi:23S rRNA pseudouridine1911/1915/1917 synthase